MLAGDADMIGKTLKALGEQRRGSLWQAGFPASISGPVPIETLLRKLAAQTVP